MQIIPLFFTVALSNVNLIVLALLASISTLRGFKSATTFKSNAVKDPRLCIRENSNA
jgi:hypothetical protein